ncbi:MAG TPA: hypothetical protein VGF01_14650 [Terracidiphilus sp.]
MTWIKHYAEKRSAKDPEFKTAYEEEAALLGLVRYPSEQLHSFGWLSVVLKLSHECNRRSEGVSQAELVGGIAARL